MTVDKNVLIRGAAAFGSNDMGIVGGCDLVDHADQAFVPSVFVVVVGCGCSLLFRRRWYIVLRIATGCICKAWFRVGYARKVESQT